MRNHLEIERMTGCPRKYATATPAIHQLFIHYDIGQHKTCKSWKCPADSPPTRPAPSHLNFVSLIIKQARHLPAWKTNKTKVSSGFLLHAFAFFYLFMLSVCGGGRGGTWVVHNTCVLMSGPISSRRTVRNLRKKEAAAPLLFVAWVRDLLNLWNYFTCISDSRSFCSPNWRPSPASAVILCCFFFSVCQPAVLFCARPFGQFLRLSLCYSDALSLQDLHTMCIFSMGWQNFYATSYVGLDVLFQPWTTTATTTAINSKSH